MNKYVIMGVQGCGKGTQAKMLASTFDLVHISVGDIFRWHVQSHTKLAAHIRRIMANGDLVPDEIVEQEVRTRLEMHDWNYGFILDGFPRNRHQADFFLQSYDIDGVIHLHVPDEVVFNRIMNRRLCDRCGVDYNLMFHHPAVAGICDVCGGNLVTRSDDNPDAVRSRLRDYRAKTEPILRLFERKGLIVTVDGTRDKESVQADMREQLKLSLRHPETNSRM